MGCLGGYREQIYQIGDIYVTSCLHMDASMWTDSIQRQYICQTGGSGTSADKGLILLQTLAEVSCACKEPQNHLNTSPQEL